MKVAPDFGVCLLNTGPMELSGHDCQRYGGCIPNINTLFKIIYKEINSKKGTLLIMAEWQNLSKHSLQIGQ